MLGSSLYHMTTGVAAEFVCGHPTIPEQVVVNVNSMHIYFRVAAAARRVFHASKTTVAAKKQRQSNGFSGR